MHESVDGTKRRNHHRGRWHQRFLDNWPLMVWISLVVLCTALYVRSTQYGMVVGVAQNIHHDVAPLQLSRVKAIYVQLGDHVTNGQVVAQMDTTVAEMQVAEAEAMLAKEQGTVAGYQGQILAQIRGADDDILKSENAIALEKERQESGAAKLAQLQAIQSDRDKQFKSNLIPQSLAEALRPEIAGLEKEMAAFPERLSLAQRTVEEQKKHRADLQATLHLKPDEDVLKAVSERTSAQLKVLSDLVEIRRREKDAYTLRSGSDGVVSDIFVLPGVVAQPGERVVSVVSKSDLIIGYLPEFRVGRLCVGVPGYAFRAGRPAVRVEVAEVIPEITPLPTRVSPISAPLASPMRSQKVVFKTCMPSDIMPGEKVEIRLESERWARAKRWLEKLRS